MTTKSKLFLIFGLFFMAMIVFVIGSGVFFIFVMPQMAAKRAVELNQKRSAETFGTITSVSLYRSSNSGKYGGSGSLSSTYTYQYVVNGVTYNAENQHAGSESDRKKQGLKVKVCYDPSDAKSSEFYYLEDNKICGK
jgi:hypothetical protein